MPTVPILFTFDQSLEMPAGVCLTSLLEHANADTFYDIFVLHSPDCNFTFSKLNELPALFGNCRITFRKVVGEFVGGYDIRGIPETAYYRLIAPDLIPEYDKILYSDVDVVIRKDLREYYELDLGDNYFAGVDNCSALRPSERKYLAESLHLDYRKGYYYSGNLVINSTLIRRDGKMDEFRKLGKNNYYQQDMDIMNIACNGRFLPLSPSFCLTTYLYDLIVNRRPEMEAIYGADKLDDALRSGIVHYNGTKPWKNACLNMDIWWEAYRKSIFFDEQFCHDFWHNQMFKLEKMSLLKRIKLVGRYFRRGGKV